MSYTVFKLYIILYILYINVITIMYYTSCEYKKCPFYNRENQQVIIRQILDWFCRVNFKKNEKTYNAANSEVLKMVQEIDNEPREPEPGMIKTLY